MENEKELIQKLQSKIDNENFSKLVQPYLNYCFVIINRIVNNKTESEDILQETLIQVLKNIERFRFESTFKTWIARIAYNQALLFIRKNKSKISYDSTEIEESKDKSSFSLEEKVFKSFEKEMIWNTVDQLSINYKVALLLFYKDELSIAEISKLQNRSENQVKVTLYRARKELRKKLEENL